MSHTPRTDTLLAQWRDDGATRGSAYIELRDLARELERANQELLLALREVKRLARATLDAQEKEAAAKLTLDSAQNNYSRHDIEMDKWVQAMASASQAEKALRNALDDATPTAANAGSHGDAIARSKRILALVDDYHEKPTADTRTALRIALMDEFEAGAPTANGADALSDLWIQEDMADDATAAVLSLPRKELKAAYVQAREDITHWKRRALEAERLATTSAPHQPDSGADK